MYTDVKKPIYVFIGIPGSGKDTQAELLAQKLNLPHIDIGTTLTNIVLTKGKHWGIIANTYKLGPAPSEVVLEIMRNRFIQEDCANGFILSQHTKSTSELELMLQLYKELNFKISKVFYLHVSEQTAIDRCVKRLNGVFTVKEPNLESLELRIKNQNAIIQDIVKFYNDRGLLVQINGEESLIEISDKISAIATTSNS